VTDDETENSATFRERVDIMTGRLLSRGGLTAGEAYAHARTQCALEEIWEGIGQLKRSLSEIESRLDKIERALP